MRLTIRFGLAISLFFVGLFVVGMVAPAVNGSDGEKKGGGGPPPAFVEVAPVEQKEISQGQTFVGTLEPRRRSVVGSAVDGRVMELLVDEGTPVKQGEPLVKLLTQTTEIELAHARAEQLHAQEVLRELENGCRPEEKAEAKAKWDSTRALLDYARARHQRAVTLREKGGSLSQDEVDQVYSGYIAAEQAQLAAKAMFEMMEQGPRKERIAQAAAQAAAQGEMVRQLEDRLEKFVIKAPFNGYVVQKFTETGAWIKRGDSIAEVVEIDPMEATANVPENSIRPLMDALTSAEESGEPLAAMVKVDALQGAPFTARVERIVPQADLRTRTFPVKLLVENPAQGNHHKLMAGMICHAVLPVGKKQEALLVPKDAMVLGGPAPMVYVADKGADGQLIAKAVPVQVGVALGNAVQVIGNLQVGDAVIIRGNERVHPGQPLQILDRKVNPDRKVK